MSRTRPLGEINRFEVRDGGYATRFCLTAYSGQPSPHGFQTIPDPLADPTPPRRIRTRPQGKGVVEGYTVIHDRPNQPTHAIAASMLPDRSRAWARLSDAEDLDDMLSADPIGRTVVFGSERDRLD